MLDLVANQQVVFDTSAFTITDVVQNGMAGTKCLVTIATNTAQMPDYPASNTRLVVEFSTDGGGTWPTVETSNVSLNLTGTTQSFVYTSTANYSTGIKVRVKWSHPYLGLGSYSAYSNIFAPTWDYFDPATVFPSLTYTGYTPGFGGGNDIVVTGIAPSGSYPNMRFSWVEDTNDGAGIGLGPGGSDIINPVNRTWSLTPPYWPSNQTITTLMIISVDGFLCF